MKNTRQTWDTTREPNLLRNTASGRYYGRFTLGGKQKWVNLDTDVWTVAKLRLADERGKIERLRQTAANVTAGGAYMGDMATLYKQRIKDRVDIKPKTKRRLREEVETIIKTWPSFATLAPGQLTRQAVLESRNRLSRDGTGFIVPGAKKANPKINGSSASLINKCIDALRRMLDIAVERGQLAGNPLYPRGLKLNNTPRKPNLPKAAKLADIFSEIERAGGGFSRNAADFCRFLAYTLCDLRNRSRSGHSHRRRLARACRRRRPSHADLRSPSTRPQCRPGRESLGWHLRPQNVGDPSALETKPCFPISGDRSPSVCGRMASVRPLLLPQTAPGRTRRPHSPW